MFQHASVCPTLYELVLSWVSLLFSTCHFFLLFYCLCSSLHYSCLSLSLSLSLFVSACLILAQPVSSCISLFWLSLLFCLLWLSLHGSILVSACPCMFLLASTYLCSSLSLFNLGQACLSLYQVFLILSGCSDCLCSSLIVNAWVNSCLSWS